MRTSHRLTLEFVRRGPAHNQLLSPVTDYLAVCGNHETATVHVPFEHWDFLERLRKMRYEGGDERARASTVRALAEDCSRILAQVPGLAGELTQPVGPALAHVRLVLSASELALIPFELSLSPPGCPASGQSLLLQTTCPLTVTREVRRVSGLGVRWPVHRPRILVAAADLPGSLPIPLQAHLVEVRSALDPWVMPSEDEREAVVLLREMLTVLPNASLEDIRAACAEHAYTHVHLLAHGAPIVDGVHEGFGLALWDHRHRGRDVVGGARLADALRAHRHGCDHRDDCCDGLSHPAVVTVASCDSGNQSDVVAPGASLAHALHTADIPFVVASQFPLTMAGSVLTVRVLYRRLLRGDDPRLVLHDLRQQLHQMDGKIHDWASVVAYAALPPDFDEQLRATQSAQARRAMAVAMARADRVSLGYLPRGDRMVGHDTAAALPEPVRLPAPPATPGAPGVSEATGVADGEEPLEAALRDLRAATACLPESTRADPALMVATTSRRTEELGLRGSAEKRAAQGFFVLGNKRANAAVEARDQPALAKLLERRASRDREREREALARARRCYRDAFLADMSTHWAAVQYLALCVVLDAEAPTEHWTIAGATASLDAREGDVTTRAWGLASILELTLLEGVCALWPKGTMPDAGYEEANAAATETLRRRVQEAWAAFLDVAPPGTPEYVSTSRQLNRYVDWWAKKPDLAAGHQRERLRLAGELVQQIVARGQIEASKG